MRETPQISRPQSFPLGIFIGGGIALAVIALLLGIFLPRGDNPTVSTPTANPSPAEPTPSANPSETVLGHFPYPQAPESELELISADGRIRLRRAAAQKFRAMVADARAQGISLVPISGFRSIEQQQQLFFGVKAQRGQDTRKRAEVSAPPGYSEHHTGYAVDVGDGNVPGTNLSPNFEKTRAFQWMQRNAAYYSFELSFPKGNTQGVTYEPWHWRYVGDQDSLEMFYKARGNRNP